MIKIWNFHTRYLPILDQGKGVRLWVCFRVRGLSDPFDFGAKPLAHASRRHSLNKVVYVWKLVGL